MHTTQTSKVLLQNTNNVFFPESNAQTRPTQRMDTLQFNIVHKEKCLFLHSDPAGTSDQTLLDLLFHPEESRGVCLD